MKDKKVFLRRKFRFYPINILLKDFSKMQQKRSENSHLHIHFLSFKCCPIPPQTCNRVASICHRFVVFLLSPIFLSTINKLEILRIFSAY